MANKSKNISWTPIIIVVLILIFIVAIVLIGTNNQNLNSNENQGNSNYDNNYAGNSNSVKTITISGVDKSQEISDTTPIKLVISGVRNTITIKENTPIDEIIVSGVDITIYLPQGNNPKITDSGIRTKISYY